MRFRFLGAVLTCLLCGAGILATFWWFDWRTSLPTPRPAQARALTLGSSPTLPPSLQALAVPGAPLLVHFYNPDCPCSRFNRDHLRGLFDRFGSTVRFVVVAQSEADSPLGDDAPGLLDRGGALAAALGVWSTPQAVLLDARGAVVYTGNYNTSRYCADRRTEFVRLALESLAQPGHPLPQLEPWGCQLPSHLAQSSTRVPGEEGQP